MTSDATDGGLALSYDQENRISGTGGYTYTYDADGNRVKKTNGTTGTIYWYMTLGIVAESDLSGTLKSEYVFFDGERVARRDLPAGSVAYYFSDHLKTASVITDSLGNIKSESDYYPWGGELQFVNNDSNHYKFTGKERDETGLDYFGARYYSNGLARFITPDWAAKAVDVPYAEFSDPQSLNLYTYVRNIPTVKVDPDGHDWHDALDYSVGVLKGVASSVSFGTVGAPSAHDSVASLTGQLSGSVAVTHISATVAEASGPAAVGGLLAAPATGGASLVVSGGAIAAVAASTATAIGGAKNIGAVAVAMGKLAQSKTGPGSVPPGERAPQRTATPAEKSQKLAEQGGKCANCETPVKDGEGIGHHYPDRYADGGKDIVVVCKGCHHELHSGSK
jgi:RHS repeat-associated protein